MSAGHHGHDHHRSSAGRLLVAFCVLGVFGGLEVVTGLLTGSLALLSDAGHMVTDVVGIGVAVVAARLAATGRAGARRTYGLHRLEILGALGNAVLLAGIGVYVLWSAVGRLSHPEVVETGPLLLVAVLGLLANVVAILLLRSGAGESLNTEAAYLEVLADLIGSVGVIVGAVVMGATGWAWVDPLVGLALAAFILPRTLRLALRALHVLLEGAPADVDVAALRRGLAAIEGVADVHDFHVWTVASQLEAASGHLTTTRGADLHAVLDAAETFIRDRHGIAHVTLQVEPDDHRRCNLVDACW
jgi:cobalt-zinc-cadmium efflux system protein